MSKGKRYTEEQILKVLGEIEAGASIASVARSHGITDQTIYRWREKYAGFIQPGKPWQNGYVESFFDKLRDELLRGAIYSTGAELQLSLDEFQDHYNHRRPHRSLQGLAPANFKEGLTNKRPEAELTL